MSGLATWELRGGTGGGNAPLLAGDDTVLCADGVYSLDELAPEDSPKLELDHDQGTVSLVNFHLGPERVDFGKYADRVVVKARFSGVEKLAAVDTFPGAALICGLRGQGAVPSSGFG